MMLIVMKITIGFIGPIIFLGMEEIKYFFETGIIKLCTWYTIFGNVAENS